MPFKSETNFTAGDNSEQNHGKVIIINKGVSLEDAKIFMLGLYHQNMIALREEAAKIAEKKAAEITEAIIDKKVSEGDSDFSRFNEPRIQDNLFNAQKAYALSNGKDQLDILADLVNKSSEKNTEFIDILFSDAIELISKLSKSHIDAATLVFLLMRTVQTNIMGLDVLPAFFRKNVIPYLRPEILNDNVFSHLASKGILSKVIPVGLDGVMLSHLLKHNYPGFFTRPFTEDYINSDFRLNQIKEQLIFKDGLYHSWLNNESGFATIGLSPQQQAVYRKMWADNEMSDQEVYQELINIDANFLQLTDYWKTDSVISRVEIAPVGMLIAMINHRKTMDLYGKRDIWI